MTNEHDPQLRQPYDDSDKVIRGHFDDLEGLIAAHHAEDKDGIIAEFHDELGRKGQFDLFEEAVQEHRRQRAGNGADNPDSGENPEK